VTADVRLHRVNRTCRAYAAMSANDPSADLRHRLAETMAVGPKLPIRDVCYPVAHTDPGAGRGTDDLRIFRCAA
jgi:hypothetical protein